jgi:ribosomal protein S18 acetylase RimI-like enzyme
VLTRRPIEAADAATIIGWFPDRQGAVFWGGAKAPEPLTPEWLIEQFDAASYWVWTEAAGVPAGVFGLVLPETKRAHLTRFGLGPAWRGRGFGRQAIGEIIAVAHDHGMTHLSLHVYESNQAAKRLYDTLGFKIVERKLPVTEWSGDNLKMLLTL